ncbi:MAG: hypothetical protein LC746_16225, partial [Acidobacteria bacterium]|nr:hypothetical protein [Acidobacteriota bacterium]
MSKFLRRSVFALVVACALGAQAARAQRVGPVEDERAATDAAKNAVEKTDAKSADKSAPKT